eukprot:9548822-Lingulodinium_polyedra.AAC.1
MKCALLAPPCNPTLTNGQARHAETATLPRETQKAPPLVRMVPLGARRESQQELAFSQQSLSWHFFMMCLWPTRQRLVKGVKVGQVRVPVMWWPSMDISVPLALKTESGM